MQRFFYLMVVMLVTALFAETQEEAYYRAMKAEEAGDIPAALQAFEEAAALPGDYTEEIQGIIRDYNVALGKPSGDTAIENPWEFHVAGELGFHGMRYKATGMDDREIGGELFLYVNPYVDYAPGAWSHTFAASVQSDYFLNNDELSLLDTNDWNFFLGLEYTLFGRSMLLDLGYVFNIEGEELSSDFYAWFEQDLYRYEKQRLGLVAGAYYQTSGPMSLNLYGSWRRTVPQGLNGSVYVGVSFQNKIDSIYINEYNVSPDVDSSVTDEEWGHREETGTLFGSVFRSRISYKFKNRIALELKMNLYFGFAISGPNNEYKKIKKFSNFWSATVSWKYWKMNYYLGLEHKYNRYFLPRAYAGINRKKSVLSQLKLGVKWDI